MANLKKGKSPHKYCKVYKERGMREINKAKKNARHLKKHPHDVQSGGQYAETTDS